MSKKHLTYDDRLAIQAGLQKGLKIAQIAKNIGKDRGNCWERSKSSQTSGHNFRRQQLYPPQNLHQDS